MPRQLAQIVFTFKPSGELSEATIQERMVADDGEGGTLSRDLGFRKIDPIKDEAALALVLDGLGRQQQVAIVALENALTEKEAVIAEKSALVAEKEAIIASAAAKVIEAPAELVK